MSSAELVAATVAGRSITFGEVLKLAKRQQSFPALEEKVKQTIIQITAEEMGLSASKEELQAEADAFRKQIGLYSAADTFAWLEKFEMTVEELEQNIRLKVFADKIRDKIAEGKAERYFNEHRLSLDAAIISHLVTSAEEEASELKYQIEEGADFYSLAREFSIDLSTKRASGFVGEVSRSALSPQVQAAIFGAQAGDIVGPVKTDLGYHLFKIEELNLAEWNEATREMIKNRLLEQWINDQVKKADIWQGL